MLIYKEYRAWIEIEGVKAKEYEIQESRNAQGVDTVTCWIASEEGKKFTINWHDTVASSATSSRFSVDGTAIPTGQSNHVGVNKPRTKKGFRVSDTEIRPFVFSSIKLTDDDQYIDNHVSEQFGDIRIKLSRCSFQARKHIPKPFKLKPVAVPDMLIHERKKKAMIHQVGAGPLTTAARHTSRYHTSEEGPTFVEFIFKYRSIDQLIASGIAPRTTTTTKRSAVGEDVVEIVEDSEEEQARAEAVLAGIIAKRARKKVKREVKQEDIKPVFLPGEVIDLT